MDNTPSSLSGDKNPFAELTDLNVPSKNASSLWSFRPSLSGVSFILQIVATLSVGLSIAFAADAYVRSGETRASFVPASFGNYLAMGVTNESNPDGLTLQGLAQKYEQDSKTLLDTYAQWADDVTYQRSLVEFFEKNPDVEFVRTQNEDKYNILTVLGEFIQTVARQNDNPQIKIDCQVQSVSDAGELKAACNILSQHAWVWNYAWAKSARVVAAELAEKFASADSSFILKNAPRSLPLTQVNDKSGYQSQSSVSLDLQALPSLLP